MSPPSQTAEDLKICVQVLAFAQHESKSTNLSSRQPPGLLARLLDILEATVPAHSMLQPPDLQVHPACISIFFGSARI